MSLLESLNEHRLTDEPTIDLFELLCRRRGWSDTFLASIDRDDHDELRGLPEMVVALEEARRTRAGVVIAPDFDMDGISAGVLGYAGLAELGFDVHLHRPDYRRGHELSEDDVAEIAAAWPDTRVLVTCDGGVNSHAGIDAARARGWVTLVTDHHEELPPGSTADVTVDPCRIDETYSNRGICGAHVLYQVLEAYTRTHQPDKQWQIRLLRLFVGLGTVADVMPLLFENRQAVRDSLSVARLLRTEAPHTLANAWGRWDPDPDAIDVEQSILMQLLRTEWHHPVFLNAFQGFALLLKGFAQVGKLRGVDDLNEGFYGFYLAPAMNSPRRTGDPLGPCFDVFTADGAEEKLEAVHTVITVNDRRKELVVSHLAELTEGDQPMAPWIYFSAAPPAMFGLLANQMLQATGHAVVVVNRPGDPKQPLGGSGRAPAGVDLITVLDPHEGLAGIGHQQACGIRLDSADRLADLAGVLTEATRIASLSVSAETASGDLILGPDADCDANLDDLAPVFELLRRLESLHPFGHGFTEPVVQIALEPLGLRIDRIGSESQHLRLVGRSGLSCLWWNAEADWFDYLTTRVREASRTDLGTLRLTARLQLNTFRDTTRIQAVIIDCVPVSA